MNDQLGARRSKRIHLKQITFQNKHQRLNEIEKLQATQITDLNDDCLQMIFEFLDIQSLVNIADSNRWLVNAARLVYIRKFSKISVVIDFNNHNCWGLTHNDTNIYVYDPKICFRLLRIMGFAITDLRICYNATEVKQFKYVEQYIKQYCSGTVRMLQFAHKPSFWIQNFEKPFTKVESVKCLASKFGNEFHYFPRWFPNLRILELDNCDITYEITFPPFPHLTKLRISWTKIPQTRISQIIRDSSQMQSLEIALKPQYELSKSGMWLRHDYVDTNRNELIEFTKAHPSIMNLDLLSYNFTTDDVIFLIQQQKALQRFRFIPEHFSQLDDILTQLNNEWEGFYGTHLRHDIILTRRM